MGKYKKRCFRDCNAQRSIIDKVDVKLAGEVKDFKPEEFMDRKEARRMGRFSQFAVAASKMAVEDAGLEWVKM